MKKRTAAGTLAISIGLSLWPSTLNAGFLGDLGKAVGGFFRGVGNILGQGLAGLAQPTVEDTANQMQRVGMSLIDQADKAAGRRIDQLSEKIAAAIEQTDQIIQRQLQVLDELLSKKLGAVDIIGTKQIFTFEQSVIGIIKYASLMALATAIIVIAGSYIFRRLSSQKYDELGVRPWATAAVVVLILSGLGAVATALIKPPSQGKLLALRTDLITSYKYAMQLGDLSGATYYASQINVLDSSNLSSRLLVEISDLQRDLLSRPALLKTSRGSLELNARAARLDRTWDLLTEQNFTLGDLDFLPRELSATAAMIVWQTARLERDEFAAACAAANALADYVNAPNKKPEDASPFVWTAYSYADWASIRVSNYDYQCDDGKKLTLKLDSIKDVVAKFATATPNPIVQHVVGYNRAASDYYKSAARSYSKMIVADTQFRSKTNKAPYQAERDKAADEISAAWGRFLDAVQQIPGAKGSNMVLALNGLPLALAQRAAVLRGSDANPASRPAFDVAACNAAANQMAGPDPAARVAGEQSRYGQFLTLFDPGIRQFVCTEQAAEDAKIVAFETAIVVTANKTGVDTTLERATLLAKPEFASFSASLAACIVLSDSTIGGDRGCKPGETSSVNTLAAWLGVAPGTPPVLPNAIRRVAFVR